VDDISLLLLCGEADFKAGSMGSSFNCKLNIFLAHLEFGINRSEDQIPYLAQVEHCTEILAQPAGVSSRASVPGKGINRISDSLERNGSGGSRKGKGRRREPTECRGRQLIW
jgi:hypothetical protein